MIEDHTPEPNAMFDLGLGTDNHASMNSGTGIADGMVYVGYGARNNPFGGVIACEINHRPTARKAR